MAVARTAKDIHPTLHVFFSLTHNSMWVGFFHFQRMLSHRYYGAYHPTVIYSVSHSVGRVVLFLMVSPSGLRLGTFSGFRLTFFLTLYTAYLTNGFRDPIVDFHLVWSLSYSIKRTIICSSSSSRLAIINASPYGVEQTSSDFLAIFRPRCILRKCTHSFRIRRWACALFRIQFVFLVRSF